MLRTVFFVLGISLFFVAGCETPKINCQKNKLKPSVITPVNVAEAIIDPFFEMGLSRFDEWNVKNGSEYGLDVKQTWCNVSFNWVERSRDGIQLDMSRNLNLDVSDYDKVIVSAVIPQGAKFIMKADTDKGQVSSVSVAPDHRMEYELDLKGAKQVDRLSFEIETDKKGFQSGYFNWIGLQNSKRLEDYKAQWKKFASMDWRKHLKPEDFEPSFNPQYGLVADSRDIEKLRKNHEEYVRKFGSSPFTKAWERFEKEPPPETMIEEYSSKEERFIRERDMKRGRKYGRHLGWPGRYAAMSGIVLKDKKLLRLAARYALCMAACSKWGAGFVSHYPVGSFEHRSFDEAGMASNISFIMDLAGECLTEMGKKFLLRALAEKGIGQMNYVAWRYQYIYNCNQLPAFSRGRIPAYLVLEKNWKHVPPYTDLAVKELDESMNNILMADGSYHEGPAYFQYTVATGLPAYYSYAKARRKDFDKVIPDKLKKTSEYAELFVSTDDNQYFIPAEDANGPHGMNLDCVAFLAAMMPDSQWINVFNKWKKRVKGQMPPNLLIWELSEKIPAKYVKPKPFVYLPMMQTLSSTRFIGSEPVKILIYGNKSGAGHNHEDKGSFVLEFAGDTYAADPGSWFYVDPLSGELKQAQRHNMLIPFGLKGERPHAPHTLKKDVVPVGKGDEKSLNVKMDVLPGWEKYYKKWTRSWDSPSPGILTITDDYELKKGEGVEFYWNTELPVKAENGVVTVSGRRGRVLIEVPKGASVRIDKLKLPKNKAQNRIAICKKGKKGTLQIKARLELKGK
jgi:hypothetical protein